MLEETEQNQPEIQKNIKRGVMLEYHADIPTCPHQNPVRVVVVDPNM